MLGKPAGPKVPGREAPMYVCDLPSSSSSLPPVCDCQSSSSPPMSPSARNGPACLLAASHFSQTPQAPVITTSASSTSKSSLDQPLSEPITAGTPPATGLLTTPPSTSYSPFPSPSARITRDPACPPDAIPFPQIPQAPAITTAAFYVDSNNSILDNALSDPIYAGTPPATGLLTTPPSSSYSPFPSPSARITRDPACLPDPDAIPFFQTFQTLQATDSTSVAFSVNISRTITDPALSWPNFAGSSPATCRIPPASLRITPYETTQNPTHHTIFHTTLKFTKSNYQIPQNLSMNSFISIMSRRRLEGNLFSPPMDVITAQTALFSSIFAIKRSKFASGGWGLFAKIPIKPRHLGFYVGMVTASEAGLYPMQLEIDRKYPCRIVDGTPPPGTPSMSHALSYINEFIWVDDDADYAPAEAQNKVVLDRHHSTAFSLRSTVSAGEELTIDLGPDYNWDDYKFSLITNILDILISIISLYAPAPNDCLQQWTAQLLAARATHSLSNREDTRAPCILDYRSTPSPSIFTCLLTIVDNLAPRPTTSPAGPPSPPDSFSSIYEWALHLATFHYFRSYSVFRRAFHPKHRKSPADWSKFIADIPVSTRPNLRRGARINYDETISHIIPDSTAPQHSCGSKRSLPSSEEPPSKKLCSIFSTTFTPLPAAPDLPFPPGLQLPAHDSSPGPPAKLARHPSCQSLYPSLHTQHCHTLAAGVPRSSPSNILHVPLGTSLMDLGGGDSMNALHSNETTSPIWADGLSLSPTCTDLIGPPDTSWRGVPVSSASCHTPPDVGVLQTDHALHGTLPSHAADGSPGVATINSNCAQTAAILTSCTAPPRVADDDILRTIALSGSRTGTLVIPSKLGDMRIVCLNSNGLSEDKLRDSLLLMDAFLIDFMILIDTRCNEYKSKSLRAIALTHLGGGSFVGYAAAGILGDNLVGGQMVFANSTWGCKQYKFWQDDSSLGMVTATYFQAGEIKLMAVGTYWPVLPQPVLAPDPSQQSSSGLWSRCES